MCSPIIAATARRSDALGVQRGQRNASGATAAKVSGPATVGVGSSLNVGVGWRGTDGGVGGKMTDVFAGGGPAGGFGRGTASTTGSSATVGAGQ